MGMLSEYPGHDEVRDALARGRGRGIRVAVIDSGVELSHPALRGLRLVDDIALEALPGRRVDVRGGGGCDVNGHGTAMAGIIRRAAPEAQIGSIRVFDAGMRSTLDLIRRAAEMACERGYQILNCSFGSSARVESIAPFKEWVDMAYRRGVHVVAPCCNLFFREAEWPGAFPTVLTVNMAATGADDVFFREEAGERHLVEFAARGVDIEVAWRGGEVVRRSGSSFAAAHVSGMLARFLSVHPRVKPLVAKSLLQEVASPWHPSLKAGNG